MTKKHIITLLACFMALTGIQARETASISSGRIIPDPARYKDKVADRVVNIPDTAILANALDDIHNRLANTSLANMPEIANLPEKLNAMAVAIKEYEAPQFEGVQMQIEAINNIADAATLYKQAMGLLASPYDKDANSALTTKLESATSRLDGLSPMQQTELIQAFMALKDYNAAIDNYNSVLLPELTKIGKIDNDNRMEQALENIDSTVDAFAQMTPNRTKGYYSKFYIFLNDKLDSLRNQIKNYRELGLKNKKTYLTILSPIS